MRWAGRMAPGNCGAVFTGQAVLFIPALTAITSAMLSFLVRPLMVGTVIGGSLAAESLPVAVLDVARGPPIAVAVVGAAFATGITVAPEEAVVDDPSVGTVSPTGVGRASLLAAHAREAISEKVMSTLMDEYLSNKLLCISWHVGGRGE